MFMYKRVVRNSLVFSQIGVLVVSIIAFSFLVSLSTPVVLGDADLLREFREGKWGYFNKESGKFVAEDFAALEEAGYSSDEIVEIATAFVQSIEYQPSPKNKYAYETFYDKKGTCLDKVVILVSILKELGYKTYVIYGSLQGVYHTKAGVACNEGNANFNGQEICFIETTSYWPIVTEDENFVLEEIVPFSENANLVYQGYSDSFTSEKKNIKIQRQEGFQVIFLN